MKTFLFLLFFSPFLCFSQTNKVFIKLTDARGQQIKGEATVQGFERWIQANTISSGGKNNTQTSFSMQVSGASAELKKALTNGELLSSCEIQVITPGPGAGAKLYTTRMEQVKVLSCTEAMDCTNLLSTTVSLQALRIGWTYFTQNKAGVQAISKKYGFDAGTNTEWTNF